MGEEGTPLLSTTVWLRVHGAFSGSVDEFFDQMERLAEHLGGDICEAGLADPEPAA